MAKTRKWVIKTHSIRQPLPERCPEKTLHRRIRIISRRLGPGKISIPLIGQTSTITLGSSGTITSLKTEQYE